MDEAAAKKEQEKAEKEHRQEMARMEEQFKKEEQQHQKELQRCEKELQKELATAQKQSQINKDRHELLSKDLEAQMKLYNEEFKAAKEMMDHAMRNGRPCRIVKQLPYLDLNKNEVIRGWVKTVIERSQSPWHHTSKLYKEITAAKEM